MKETGYIKFHCEHIPAGAARFAGFDELNKCRARLHRLGLIGLNPEGIGYGNVSIRAGDTRNFFITGTMTGGIAELTPANYTEVTAFDFARNWLRCVGPARASAESLTHAAIYEIAPDARAVIHVHHFALWKKLLDLVPTTSREIAYGTPEMAREIQRLFSRSDLPSKKIVAMAGHIEGIVTFGAAPGEAFDILIEAFLRAGVPLEKSLSPPPPSC